MKRILKAMALGVWSVVLLYLFCSLLAWDFNVSHWDNAGKVMFGFIGIISLAGVTALYLTQEYE